jgi:hypothetical protein
MSTAHVKIFKSFNVQRQRATVTLPDGGGVWDVAYDTDREGLVEGSVSVDTAGLALTLARIVREAVVIDRIDRTQIKEEA